MYLSELERMPSEDPAYAEYIHFDPYSTFANKTGASQPMQSKVGLGSEDRG